MFSFLPVFGSKATRAKIRNATLTKKNESSAHQYKINDPPTSPLITRVNVMGINVIVNLQESFNAHFDAYASWRIPEHLVYISWPMCNARNSLIVIQYSYYLFYWLVTRRQFWSMFCSRRRINYFPIERSSNWMSCFVSKGTWKVPCLSSEMLNYRWTDRSITWG